MFLASSGTKKETPIPLEEVKATPERKLSGQVVSFVKAVKSAPVTLLLEALRSGVGSKASTSNRSQFLVKIILIPSVLMGPSSNNQVVTIDLGASKVVAVAVIESGLTNGPCDSYARAILAWAGLLISGAMPPNSSRVLRTSR